MPEKLIHCTGAAYAAYAAKMRRIILEYGKIVKERSAMPEKLIHCQKCSYIGEVKKTITIIPGAGNQLVISCPKCDEPVCYGYEGIYPPGIRKNDSRQGRF